MELIKLIGKTPCVKINSKTGNISSNVFIKLEQFNLGGSIKSRVALQMVLDAEKKGILKPFSNYTIIEPTGGNTGIGLAILGVTRGYKVKLVIPDNYSKTRIKLLKYYGAEILLSDSNIGNDSHIVTAKKEVIEHPEYIMLDQFNNSSNPLAHYNYTADEIINSIDSIDYFVCGIGSGGTIMGVGKKLKEINKNVKIIGVQPEGCDLMKNEYKKHGIQGIAIGYKSSFLDYSIIDDFISIKDKDAIQLMYEVPKMYGHSFGISSCANLLAAFIIKNQVSGKNIVTVAPDGLNNYYDIL